MTFVRVLLAGTDAAAVAPGCLMYPTAAWRVTRAAPVEERYPGTSQVSALADPRPSGEDPRRGTPTGTTHMRQGAVIHNFVFTGEQDNHRALGDDRFRTSLKVRSLGSADVSESQLGERCVRNPIYS